MSICLGCLESHLPLLIVTDLSQDTGSILRVDTAYNQSIRGSKHNTLIRVDNVSIERVCSDTSRKSVMFVEQSRMTDADALICWRLQQ